MHVVAYLFVFSKFRWRFAAVFSLFGENLVRMEGRARDVSSLNRWVWMEFLSFCDWCSFILRIVRFRNNKLPHSCFMSLNGRLPRLWTRKTGDLSHWPLIKQPAVVLQCTGHCLFYHSRDPSIIIVACQFKSWVEKEWRSLLVTVNYLLTICVFHGFLNRQH